MDAIAPTARLHNLRKATVSLLAKRRVLEEHIALLEAASYAADISEKMLTQHQQQQHPADVVADQTTTLHTLPSITPSFITSLPTADDLFAPFASIPGRLDEASSRLRRGTSDVQGAAGSLHQAKQRALAAHCHLHVPRATLENSLSAPSFAKEAALLRRATTGRTAFYQRRGTNDELRAQLREHQRRWWNQAAPGVALNDLRAKIQQELAVAAKLQADIAAERKKQSDKELHDAALFALLGDDM